MGWWARWLLCAFGDRRERIGDRKIKGNAAAVEGDWGGVLIVWVRPDELPDGWMDGWIGVVALILVGVRHSSTARTRDRGMHRVLSMYAHSLASERHRYPTVLPATYHLDIVSVPPCHLTKDQTRLILAAGRSLSRPAKEQRDSEHEFFCSFPPLAHTLTLALSTMLLTLRTYDHRHTIQVDDTDSFDVLRAKIAEHTNVPIEQQRLLLRGSLLAPPRDRALATSPSLQQLGLTDQGTCGFYRSLTTASLLQYQSIEASSAEPEIIEIFLMMLSRYSRAASTFDLFDPRGYHDDITMIATIVVMKERQYGPRPPIDRRMPTRDAVQAATATLTPDYPPIDDAELSDLTNVRRHQCDRISPWLYQCQSRNHSVVEYWPPSI